MTANDPVDYGSGNDGIIDLKLEPGTPEHELMSRNTYEVTIMNDPVDAAAFDEREAKKTAYQARIDIGLQMDSEKRLRSDQWLQGWEQGFTKGAKWQHPISREAGHAKATAEIERLQDRLNRTEAQNVRLREMSELEEVKRLRAELAHEKARAAEVIEAVNGLMIGVDWNNGTHAEIYRPKVITAVEAYKSDDTQLG